MPVTEAVSGGANAAYWAIDPVQQRLIVNVDDARVKPTRWRRRDLARRRPRGSCTKISAPYRLVDRRLFEADNRDYGLPRGRGATPLDMV